MSWSYTSIHGVINIQKIISGVEAWVCVGVSSSLISRFENIWFQEKSRCAQSQTYWTQHPYLSIRNCISLGTASSMVGELAVLWISRPLFGSRLVPSSSMQTCPVGRHCHCLVHCLVPCLVHYRVAWHCSIAWSIGRHCHYHVWHCHHLDSGVPGNLTWLAEELQ